MEIVAGIHRIEVPFGERFVCMFLLVGEEACLLIDTGTDAMPREHLAPYLEQIGLAPAQIRYVLISHADFDHTAGNASVREMCPEAVFMCHALDQNMVEDIECMIGERYSEFERDHGIGDGEEAKQSIRQASRHIPMDMLLQGGERLRLGPNWWVEILHTPGHTRGHLSVRDPASQALIIADATLYNAVLQADGQPAFPPTYRYLDTYLASLHWIMHVADDILLTSHYPVYRQGEVAEFLSESRAFVDRVDQALAQALIRAGTPRTMGELIDELGSGLGQWPAGASPYLCYPFLGHLERMVSRGLVETQRRAHLLAYRWK